MRSIRFTRPGSMISPLLLVLLFALMTGMVYSPARAQTPNPNDQVYSVAKQLNCPTCAGRNLADCPTDTCMQWKKEIQDQLQQGKTPQQVISYFKARFGPGVLQEPPKQGAILILWLLPVFGLLALTLGAVVFLKRVSRPAPIRVTGSSSIHDTNNDSYVQRLEDEVRESRE